MEGEGRVLTPRERAGLELQAGLAEGGMVYVEFEGLDDAESAAVARSLPPKAKT
jgi:hypothetical protein